MPKPETLPITDRRPRSAISRNRLLAALPGADYARLAPALDIVPLTLKAFLYKSGDPDSHGLRRDQEAK